MLNFAVEHFLGKEEIEEKQEQENTLQLHSEELKEEQAYEEETD